MGEVLVGTNGTAPCAHNTQFNTDLVHGYISSDYASCTL